MKNYRLFLAIASCSFVVVGGVIGCSDDTAIDGGVDSGADAATDTGAPDASNDAASDGSPDAGSDGAVDAGPPPTAQEFLDQVASQMCARMEACCLQGDAGTMDDTKCHGYMVPTGFQNSNAGLAALVAAADGGAEGGAATNVTIDAVGAKGCLNAIKALPCSVPSAAYETALQACYIDALHGKLTTGQTCTRSVECQQPAYCRFTAADAGTGTCQPLVAQGGDCTSVDGTGYAQAATAQEACSRRATGQPALFCDNIGGDLLVKDGGWTCQSEKSSASSCLFNTTCTSQICDSTSNLCADSLALAPASLCQAWH